MRIGFPKLGKKRVRSRATRREGRERRLKLESLERRELMAVVSQWFSGDMLVVKTDNNSTSVNVRQVGSQIRIQDLSTNRSWDYAATRVNQVEFQGGRGNDRFVNYARTLPVRAFGGNGNDYLEGYNGADVLVGGDGDDTLVGFGGNDRMWGGDDNDELRGGSGNDKMWGGNGNDRIEGGSGNDTGWGQNGNDVLLGGSGNDQLVGGANNDEINGQSGNDKAWGGSGNDVIVSIDAAFADYVEGGSGSDVLWIDRSGSSRDRMYGNTSSDKVQEVSRFNNGADRTLNGDRIQDPSVKSGDTYRRFSNNPLFGSRGPRLTDVVQGSLADCYFLAGLAAVADDTPHAIRQSVVDFHDGTYGVRFGNNFYRVDSDLPVGSSTSTRPSYAQLGANNSMWVAIMEKAFAHHRKGSNSYASVEWGWSVEVNRALGSRSAGDKSIESYSSAKSLGDDLYRRVSGRQAVTIGFTGAKKKSSSSGAPLIMGHQYAVARVNRNSAGTVTSIVLRNPWGTDGAGSDGSNDGFVTVTPAQIYAHRGAVNWGRV